VCTPSSSVGRRASSRDIVIGSRSVRPTAARRRGPVLERTRQRLTLLERTADGHQEQDACNANPQSASIFLVDRRKETVVFVRVVRFTDVTAERMESLVARIDETGPPPGVPIKKLQLVFDEAQGTAVVLQYFDNEEDLRAGAETFAAMDPSETPGSRVSVDAGELKVERDR
jgi:hypothetical protein